MKEKIINILPCLFALAMGIVGVVITNVLHLGFIKSFICGIIMCISTLFINWIIIKIGKVDSAESASQTMKVYFISNIILVFAIAYIAQHKIFDAIISSLLYEIVYNFLPMLIVVAFQTEGVGTSMIGSGSFLNDTKTNYGTDISDIKYSQKDNFDNTTYRNQDGTINEEIAYSKKGNFGETIYYGKDGSIKGTSKKDNFGNEHYQKK